MAKNCPFIFLSRDVFFPNHVLSCVFELLNRMAFFLIQTVVQNRPPGYLHEVDNSSADRFYVAFEV